MQEFTSIPVYPATRDRAATKFLPRENWDDLVNRLLDDSEELDRLRAMEVKSRA